MHSNEAFQRNERTQREARSVERAARNKPVYNGRQWERYDKRA
jgi:hypothetical protein